MNPPTTPTVISSGNPLPDSHILLNIVLVGDETVSKSNTQPALVRRELTVARLIEEVMREFAKEKELDRNSQYSMSFVDDAGTRHTLPADVTIQEAGLNDGARLLMTYKMSGMTAMIPSHLRDQVTTPGVFLDVTLTAINSTFNPRREKVFKLTHFPAIIGRRPIDENYTSLDVDLTELEDDGDRRISRAQARLTQEGGKLYVESLRTNNPVRLRDQPVVEGKREPLNSGDVLSLRGVTLRIDYRKL